MASAEVPATDWTALSARASLASHRLIGWIYWDPGALERYAALGVEMGGISYIASRSAPLARAGAQVVAATFYSISPEFIAAALAITEERTSFAAIAAARDDAVVAGLNAYVPEICSGLASLAPALWAAADALPVSGRALFAAHRQQPRPDDELLSAWLAVNCIREWRGDTHFAVLATENISGIQAGLLHNAYMGYPKDWIPRSRGADDADIAEAYATLAARGFADGDVINDAGLALRERIETRTDSLCERAWRAVGLKFTTEFLALVEPVGDRLVARIDETAGTEWMPAARHRRGR
jgi:hypothetical protein